VLKIKSGELFFGSAVFLQGSSLLINALLRGGSAWVAFAVSLIAALPLVILYNRINIFECFGKWVICLYVIFFILIASYNINLLSSFVGSYILEETPKIIFVILFTALCTYGVSGGIKRLMQLAVIFFAVAVFSDIINMFLLRDTVKIENLIPSGNPARGIFCGAMLLLCDMLTFTCFPKEMRGAVWGYIIGGILLFCVILRTVATLGVTTGIFTWPTHEALRLIDSENAVTRIETSSVFVIVALLFFKVSVILCGAAEGIKKATGIKKETVPSLITGVAAAAVSGAVSFPAALSMNFVFMWGGVIILPFAVVFPLIGAVLKRKNKNFQKNLKKC